MESGGGGGGGDYVSLGFMFALDKLLRKCDLNALTGGMAIRSNRKATQENEEGTSGQGSGLFPW